MPIVTLHARWEQIQENRCFFLFLAMLILLIAMPFLVDTAQGRLIIGVINITMLMSAVAAVGRSKFSLIFAFILAVPTLTFQVLALQSGDATHFALSWSCNATFYALTLARLLLYVLHRDVMTADKLYGAVAAYMLVAILWAFLYGVLQYFYPGAYAVGGTPKTLNIAELIYFSFTALSTAGFGDITPVLIQSRFLTVLEMVTGVMYVAILIARLTGVYPVIPKKS
jgi:hypothetical protein